MKIIRGLLVFVYCLGAFGGDVLVQNVFAENAGELGRVPILEYHHVGPEESRWTRSYENFRGDLEWLYNNDYRALSVDGFAEGRIDVAAGKKPVILTFDDGTENQFRYLESGEIDPNSAVGIMDDFLEEYPDFGAAAVFYVNRVPFGDEGTMRKKMEYLLESGRQIGNHTIDHGDLSKVSLEVAQQKVDELDKYIDGVMGRDLDLKTIAYPFGGVPKGDLENLEMGLLVGADPAYVPGDERYDEMRVARIQAIDDEWKRWFQREPGEVARDEGTEIFTPYVSSGLRAAAEEVRTEEPEIVYPYQECQDPDVDKFDFEGKVPFVGLVRALQSVEFRALPEGLVFDDGLFFYLMGEGENLDTVAEKFFDVSEHYLQPVFRNRIVEVNGGEGNVGEGKRIVIPDVEFISIRPILPYAPRKGIYFTGYTAANQEGFDKTWKMLESGGNTIVFDLKNVGGSLGYEGFDVKKYVQYWRKRGVFMVARVVVMKDSGLANARPELTPKNRYTGASWANSEGVVWLDPSHPELLDFYGGMMRDIAELGVDEIQLDYIRFPAKGDVAAAKYFYEENEPEKEKWQVIRDFIKRMRSELAGTGVDLSADLFGVVAWNNGYDGYLIGQKVECLAPYLDAIYPMVYPSHYGDGFGGISNPGGQPYVIVQRSLELFQDLTAGTRAEIRPWLQGFAWGATGYGTEYVRKQIQAGVDIGIDGFIIWNASNRYTESFPAFIQN